MNTRPKIKIPFTTNDLFIGFMGWLTIGILWTLTLYYYPNLPDLIPTHFNKNGQVDKTDVKLMLFILPAIATFICTGLSILNRFPHIFNYPIAITADNAEKQYKNATKMIRWLRLSIAFIFLMIAFQTIQLATKKAAVPEVLFILIIFSILFIPFIFLILAVKNK